MKLKLTILFSLLTSFCFSHQDYRASLNNENIHIEYKTGWVDFEINNKFKILSELSHRLIEKSNTNNIPIYLSFVHDYTAVDEPYFTVGYGDFSYLEYSDTSSVIHNDNGLIIKMRGHDINIKEILNVINNSVKNINYVIGDLNQYKFESMYRGEVLIESIPIDSVMAFSNSTSPLVDEILDIKIYRNIDPVSRPRSIDYYFRNNSFHFYNTREPQKEWNPETKKTGSVQFFR